MTSVPDTRPCLVRRGCANCSSLPQCQWSNPTNGHREGRYNRCATSSESLRQKHASTSYYCRCTWLSGRIPWGLPSCSWWCTELNRSVGDMNYHVGELSCTFVATNIWLRMPRCSIHSPMNFSDVSSWLRYRSTLVQSAINHSNVYDVLVVGGIDEISTGFVERIQQLEALLLVHGSHANFIPLVSNAHGTETKG